VASPYGALKDNEKSIERTVFIVNSEEKLADFKKGLHADEELFSVPEDLT
jgi:hypothetical protein